MSRGFILGVLFANGAWGVYHGFCVTDVVFILVGIASLLLWFSIIISTEGDEDNE